MSETSKITPSTAPVGAMATVEERAQQLIERHRQWAMDPKGDTESLKGIFEQSLRDQIEDCATVVQGQIEIWDKIGIGSSDIAADTLRDVLPAIRALAEPPSPKTQSAINKGLDTLSATVDRAGELLRAAGVGEGEC